MESQSSIPQHLSLSHNISGLVNFYQKAKEFSLGNDSYKRDIEWQNSVRFENIDEETFFHEYVWVVICSGFKVSIGKQIIQKLNRHLETHPNDFSVIGNQLKRKAIEYGAIHHGTWLKQLREIESDEKKLEFLQMLSFIGPVTKYHLAKNIGLQYAKPDVHLVRVATHFGFEDVQEVCKILATRFGDKIPTVDLILWRYCAENPSYHKDWIS